jgi:hypothetical protein
MQMTTPDLYHTAETAPPIFFQRLAIRQLCFEVLAEALPFNLKVP